jgi:uncharacterized membrane protein (UPF0182 family)
VLTRRWLIAAAVAVALLLLLGKALAGVYVDYRWFSALGAESVWWARIENLLILRGLSGAVATAFFFCNLYAVRHSVVSLVLPRRVANIEIGEEVPSRYLLLAVIAMSLLFGILLAFPQDDWTSLALVRWGQPFREADPYFEYDLGFWTYWLPFETSLHVWSLIALLAATTVVVFLYALTPSLRWERGTLHVSGYVRRHLSLLGALLIFLLAWSYRLDGLGLLLNGTGAGGAFTSADWKVAVPANFVLAFATGAAAVLVGWAAWTGQVRIAFVAVTAVLALSLGLRQFLPPLAQRLAGPVDPEARESPYLATRAGYTRRAYAADRVVTGDAADHVALPSLRDAVQSLSEWDAGAIRRAVDRRRQGIVSGAIGWATDSARLVAVAAQRPTGADAVDPFASWTVTRVRAWSSDDRGGITGLTGGGVEEGGAIPAALVYDSAMGPLVVSADREGDVDAPEISRWPSRVAHAWDQQNLRLMFSDVEVKDPRMMLHRDVHHRIRMLAPFFWQSAHVTPIAWRDTLYWAIHLYSATDYYPLSEHTHLGGEDVSYVRHAATAIVHAQSGHVTLVADSVLDPIAATWVRRFPSLFTSWSSLPAAVAANVPPPIESSVAQAAAFARVGTREDPSLTAHLPGSFSGDTSLFGGANRPPYLTPIDSKLAWTTPVLEVVTERVRGIIISVGGPQPATYWYKVGEPGLRWPAVLERLLRVPESPAPPRDVTLRRGPVRVVPIREGTAAYLQTTYAWRSDGAPTVARVAVHGAGPARDSVAFGLTLAEAVGMRPETPNAASTITPADFRQRVNDLYAAMREALRRGDWPAFGKAYDDLGRLLKVPTPK